MPLTEDDLMKCREEFGNTKLKELLFLIRAINVGLAGRYEDRKRAAVKYAKSLGLWTTAYELMAAKNLIIGVFKVPLPVLSVKK